ncbi:MAG TPA: hypothetical protein VK494_02390 [Gemmatimonadaceae bacterium]|nr:hypothetical protein [Gemmatimonadaceae bacterium]
MSVITIGAILGVVRIVLGWLDRQVAAPVMRERINQGRDKFFEEEDKNWGASELDKIIRLEFDEV